MVLSVVKELWALLNASKDVNLEGNGAKSEYTQCLVTRLQEKPPLYEGN